MSLFGAENRAMMPIKQPEIVATPIRPVGFRYGHPTKSSQMTAASAFETFVLFATFVGLGSSLPFAASGVSVRFRECARTFQRPFSAISGLWQMSRRYSDRFGEERL